MEQAIDSATVVGRVRLLLESFKSEGTTTLGLSELARRSDVPKSSTYRLAEQLVAAGLLERAGSRYQLGRSLFDLGELVPERRRLREVAIPFLEDVFVATRETVHLAVRDGEQVVYVEKLSSHQGVGQPSRIAGRMPMHCTATGKALLAHAPEEVWNTIMSRPLERMTRHTIVVADVLAQDLAAIRVRGYAVENEETRLGFTSVAAPIFSREGVVAALSATGPVGRLVPERVASAVQIAARGMSRRLGQRAEPPVAS